MLKSIIKNIWIRLARICYLLGSAFMVVSLVISVLPTTPAIAASGSGRIWTTSGNCQSPNLVDKNHYITGEAVVIRGDGFDPNSSYDWSIVGKPGGASTDPGQVVASGNQQTDNQGYFCVDAYTILPGDAGVYQVKLGTKGDNYGVEAVVPTNTPTEPPPTNTPTEPPPTNTTVPTVPPPPTKTPGGGDILIPVTGPESSFWASANPVVKRNYIASTSTNAGFMLFGLGLVFHGLSLWQKSKKEEVEE